MRKATHPPVRISEIVLRTARYAEMGRWYDVLLGVAPHLDNGRVAFRRLHCDYPYTQVLAIFNRPELAGRERSGPGLDHVQFRYGSLGVLVERYERLRDLGVRPFRAANHGPGTSLYYRDPDENVVELSATNFDSEAEYLAYFDSEAFRRNVSGVELDPEVFAARYRSGVSPRALVRIP
jgi:catechol-2,3-dioxygenase